MLSSLRTISAKVEYTRSTNSLGQTAILHRLYAFKKLVQRVTASKGRNISFIRNLFTAAFISSSKDNFKV